jgi:hypothetical protein
MNLVALTGRFKPCGPSQPHVRPGWGVAAIEVRRRAPADPGAVVVTLVLPPSLARAVSEGLRTGDHIAVVGGLDIDVDASRGELHPVVVAESVEALDD